MLQGMKNSFLGRKNGKINTKKKSLTLQCIMHIKPNK